MPAPDPNTRDHFESLGFIQPNGLVVSASTSPSASPTGAGGLEASPQGRADFPIF